MGFLTFLSCLPFKSSRKCSYDFKPGMFDDEVEIYRTWEQFQLVADPIDLQKIAEPIQKKILEKIPDHKSFTQFEIASRATRDLYARNEDVLFTERKKATLRVISTSSFRQQYRCRYVYDKIRITENCFEILTFLLTLPAEVKCLAVKNPEISAELLSALIEKLHLQSFSTDGNYSTDLFKTEDIVKLDRIRIMGSFTNENLQEIGSRMPRSLQLYKTAITSEAVISFCQEAVAGSRDLKKLRVTKSKLCSAQKVCFSLNAKRDLPRCPIHSRYRTLEAKGHFWIFVAKRRDFIMKRYECLACQKFL